MGEAKSMTPLEAYRLIAQTYRRRGEHVDEAFGVLFKAAEQAEATAPVYALEVRSQDEGFQPSGRELAAVLRRLAERLEAETGDGEPDYSATWQGPVDTPRLRVLVTETWFDGSEPQPLGFRKAGRRA